MARRFLLALSIAFITLASSQVAIAVPIAINFVGGRGAPGPGGAAPTATAFGVAAGDWNNLDGHVGAGTASVATGGSGTVGVSWSSANEWTLDGVALGSLPAGDPQVWWGYLDDGGPGPTITVSGLSQFAASGTYSVTVLLSSSDGSTGGIFEDTTVTLTSPAGMMTVVDPVAAPAPWNPGGSDDRIGTAFFGGLLSDSFTITTADTAGGRGSIAGIIIEVVPEPTTAMLSVLAMGGLTMLRRRRTA